MARFGKIGDQYLDDAGDVLINGKLFFYESGTNTDKTTFADVNLSIPNTNPVILTGAGRQPNIFFNGTARVVLTKNDNTQVEVRDPEGDTSTSGQFNNWNSLTIYNDPDIVIGSDGNFYISITDGNQGNDPVTDAVNWSQVRFIRVYNANEEYEIEQVIQFNGALYTSLTNNNIGNDPATDTVNWTPSIQIPEDNLARASITDYGLNNFGGFK